MNQDTIVQAKWGAEGFEVTRVLFISDLNLRADTFFHHNNSVGFDVKGVN